jgi:phage tail-like protein
MTFPLVQPVLKINYFVTMWDTPGSNTPAVGAVIGTGLSALLSIATPFLTGGFSEVEGLDAETELESYHEGGHNHEEHRFFTRATYPKLTFKRGVTVNTEIWDWHHQVITGKRKQRKSGTIIVMDNSNFIDVPGVALPFIESMPVGAWTFHNALPTKLSGPQLNAAEGEGDAIAIEALELHPERTERLSLALIPGMADVNSAVAGLAGGIVNGMAGAASAIAGGAL